MNLELQQLAKEKYAEGMPVDEIARYLKVRRITVAHWLGIEIAKASIHVPVVPDVEGAVVYRVILAPRLTRRKEGGWTATGETLLCTKYSSRAIELCASTKNTVVVQNHGIVLRYNNVRGIQYAAANFGGFRFGRAVKG